MKTVIYEQYGDPGVLKIIDTPIPQVKENEILVKVAATTVTYADIRMRKANPWLVKMANGYPKPRNRVLGQEFSGRVEATGSNVTRFKPGDEVFGTKGFAMNAYAEYLTIKESSTVLIRPEGIDHFSAAAAPFGGLTALHFLRKGKTGPGRKILIYGASGNVGSAAVQIALAMGADVEAVCSTKNLEMVSSLGARAVFDYTRGDGYLGENNYDIIFDTVGFTSFERSCAAVRDGGYYLRAVHFTPSVIMKGVTTNLKGRIKVIGGGFTEKLSDLEFLRDLMTKGKYKPFIDRQYSLDQIVDAHRYVETGRKRGSVVVLPSG